MSSEANRATCSLTEGTAEAGAAPHAPAMKLKMALTSASSVSCGDMVMCERDTTVSVSRMDAWPPGARCAADVVARVAEAGRCLKTAPPGTGHIFVSVIIKSRCCLCRCPITSGHG